MISTIALNILYRVGMQIQKIRRSRSTQNIAVCTYSMAIKKGVIKGSLVLPDSLETYENGPKLVSQSCKLTSKQEGAKSHIAYIALFGLERAAMTMSC